MFKERFHFREKISRILTWDFPHFEIIYTKAQISILLSQILWLSIYIIYYKHIYLKFSQWQEQIWKVAVWMDLLWVAFAHYILPKLHKSLETPEKAGMYHTKYFYICTLQHWKKKIFSGTAFFITKMKVSIQILTRLKIKPFAGKHTVPLCSIAHLWCYHNPENNVLPVSMYSVPKTTSAFFEWKCNSNFINWRVWMKILENLEIYFLPKIQQHILQIQKAISQNF